MISKMKKRKGFTLVELLAVIVVLAIILIFAIPIVQRVMRNAQENAFLNYAQNMIRQANARFQLDNMNPGATPTCYTLQMLDMTVTGSYHGRVRVVVSPGVDPQFFVYLTDGNRTIAGVTSNQIDAHSFLQLHHPTALTAPNNGEGRTNLTVLQAGNALLTC